MSTVCQCNKEKKRNTHSRVREAFYNIAPLLSYSKRAEFPPPPTPASHLCGCIWCSWRLNLAFSPCVKVAKSRRRARGGGGLGFPPADFSSSTGISFFAYFSTTYLTSGPFSCWYFLLLKQRIFWYYFGCQVMAILSDFGLAGSEMIYSGSDSGSAFDKKNFGSVRIWIRFRIWIHNTDYKQKNG